MMNGRYPIEEGSPASIAVSEQAIFHFPEGLPGFEELTHFLLCERDGLRPLTLLIALDEADVVLPLLRSSDLSADYSPPISMSDLEALAVRSVDELELFVVVMFRGKDGEVAVNLRAPICANRARRLGRQVVLADATYPLQYPLVQTSE